MTTLPSAREGIAAHEPAAETLAATRAAEATIDELIAQRDRARTARASEGERTPLSSESTTGSEKLALADARASRDGNPDSTPKRDDESARIAKPADERAEAEARLAASRESLDRESEIRGAQLRGELRGESRAELRGAETRTEPAPNAAQSLAPVGNLQASARVDDPARAAEVARSLAPDAVTEYVAELARNGGGTARIRLNPPELGQVEISVRVNGSSVEVSLRVEQESSHQMLSDGRERLGEALATRELRIESFEVASSSGRPSSGNGQASTSTDSSGGRSEGSESASGDSAMAGEHESDAEGSHRAPGSGGDGNDDEAMIAAAAALPQMSSVDVRV